MKIAIAVYEGETSFNGRHRKVRILSCSDPAHEGLKFCVHESYTTRFIPYGRHILVRFYPDDQFCTFVELDDVMESLLTPS